MKKGFLVLAISISVCLILLSGCAGNTPGYSATAFSATINVQSASSAQSSTATLFPQSLSPTTSTIPYYKASPIGEWILRDGNFGPGIIGKINGKDYLLAAVNNGILILDLQNQENPTKVAYLESQDPGDITGLMVSGTVLYVSKSDYLWIINVSNPSKPKELTRLLNISPTSIAISGRYAYICMKDEGQIIIVDVSDPAHPKEAGSFTMPAPKTSFEPTPSPFTPFNLKISGSLLFVLDAPSGDPGDLYWPPNGLHIIDISSPLSLKYLGYLQDNHPGYPIVVPVPYGSPPRSIPQPSEFWDMAIIGKYAYIAASGPDGMLVLDISSPFAPKEISHVPQTGANLIKVAGNLAFLPSGGLAYIVDISDPNNPKEISYFDASQFEGDVYSYSDVLVLRNCIYFLVNSQTSHGIIILDASVLSK